jgi:hypothetical protein
MIGSGLYGAQWISGWVRGKDGEIRSHKWGGVQSVERVKKNRGYLRQAACGIQILLQWHEYDCAIRAISLDSAHGNHYQQAVEGYRISGTRDAWGRDKPDNDIGL